MKIGFYSPYIPDSSIGGGEKHMFDMALVLAAEHEVTVLVPEDKFSTISAIRSMYEDFFAIDLAKVNFIPTPIGTKANIFKKLWQTSKFDYLFYWTDGSLFFSLAKQNNLHIQIPFTNKKLNIIDQLKLENWKIKNANSQFTRQIIEKHWKTNVPFVIYPMVDVKQFNPGSKKEKIILNVGRFFRQLHSKRQDVLVTAFKQMADENKAKMKDWQLVLLGTAEDKDYFKEVVAATAGYNILVIDTVTRQELIAWYNKASLYWHATGYEVDQDLHPEKVEHFGITTIEAMAAGAVPVVINKGGQPEILGTSLSDLLWDDLSKLKEMSLVLMGNRKLYKQFQEEAVIRAQDFSREQFTQNVMDMIAKTNVK